MNLTRREFLKLTGASIITMNLLSAEKVLSSIKGFKIPVLMYHEIGWKNAQYFISTSDFASQMEVLYQGGYKTIFVKELENVLNSNKENLDKIVIITFDDGSISFLDYAFPVLKEYNFKVTMNIVGRWTEEPRMALSWHEVKFLKDSGFVDIGCHSYDFHRYPGYIQGTEREIDEDMKKFQKIYTQKLGEFAQVLSIPYGNYNDKVIEIALNNGFKYILISEEGYEKGYITENTKFERISRINIDKNVSFEIFLQIIQRRCTIWKNSLS